MHEWHTRTSNNIMALLNIKQIKEWIYGKDDPNTLWIYSTQTNPNEAWEIGLSRENNKNLHTIYCCASNVLPTEDLRPDLFFRGIPFDLIYLYDKWYYCDNDTGQLICIDGYL